MEVIKGLRHYLLWPCSFSRNIPSCVWDDRKSKRKSSPSLRGKRFRAVSELQTKNESQRPSEKMGRVAKSRVPRRSLVFLCAETTWKRLLRRLELARQRQVSSRNGITGLKQNVWQFRSLWTDLLKPGVKQQRHHIYHACTRVYKWPPDGNFASISIVHWRFTMIVGGTTGVRFASFKSAFIAWRKDS